MASAFTESIVEDPAFTWLKSTGGRGVIYYPPGEAIPTPEDIFGTGPAISAPSSPNLAGSSPDLADRRDAKGCLLSDWFQKTPTHERQAYCTSSALSE